MIDEIKAHFEAEYPREACGIIGIVKGRKKWFPCTNVSETEEDFVMSSEDWFEVKKKADIYAVVHNHIYASNAPSQNDMNNCNGLGIPYYIFSYPDLELNIVHPKENFNPLIGREYEFGVNDCFEAMRDWLGAEGIKIPRRAAFEDDWWLKGLDYFTEEVISEWGFKKVDSPQKNDLLVFAVESSLGNHCGVYLSNDVFFHHAENRLSCRESLYPFWGKHIIGIYRHEA
jgi:proteasome lid subunit RPN8/RPN11